MKTNFDKVTDFNTCFGHFVTNDEYPNIYDEQPKLVELKYSLINEEVEELTDAIRDNDINEIIDALSDIKYVVNGFGGAFGINIDKEFKEMCNKENDRFNSDSKNLSDSIQNNKIKLTLSSVPWCQHNIDISSILDNKENTNFSITKKINELYYETTKRKNYNINEQSEYDKWDSHKFYGFELYDYDSKDYYKNMNDRKYRNKIRVVWKDIIKYNQNLKFYVDNKNFEETKHNLLRLLYVVEIMGLIVGVDLDESFDIVHKSNMTKICNSEEEAKKTIEWYLKNEHRYKTPTYKKNEFGWVIYNRDTNKVLKNMNYVKAGFSSLIKNYSGAENEFNPKTEWLKI